MSPLDFCRTVDDSMLSRWYNAPPSSSKSKTKAGASGLPNGTRTSEAEDSAPLDFDTFVPTHDPSLAVGATAPSQQSYGAWAQSIAGASDELVDQDEAFQRALNAMYWSGYYTAVYHVRLPVFLSPSELCSWLKRSITVSTPRVAPRRAH